SRAAAGPSSKWRPRGRGTPRVVPPGPGPGVPQPRLGRPDGDLHLGRGAGARAALTLSCRPPGSHDKGPEAEEGVELQEGGDGPGAEEQTAVAIASVQQAAFGDHNIQYQFRTENNGGQVTYRVVQVTDGQLDGQGDTAGAVSVVSTAAFAGGQQAVTQVGVEGAAQRPGPAAASVPPGPAAPFPLAVIQNPFSNGGSPAAEAVSGEARFAYFPASSVGDTTAVSVQTTDQSLQAGGQFYVMMTPQDVLQTGTQRTIAPRTHPYSPKIDGTRTPRDERRRAQHNEVERRRRDKINNWIVQLSKIIPDCNADNSKTGASKGGILSKACDYIRELRQTNQRMQETFKEAERLQMDNELLRQQIEELKNENAVLRAQLQQHNLEMVGESTRQ
ncbi:PREDICTED: upstream stimulatory factor 2, partial [Ceratotherium simum simum]|uniref:Upstream stimulatory factor 2 n=1 Tax=Ceratotherium simum simum TaxID=73337 RepID=A0ABM1DEI9_CERSS